MLLILLAQTINAQTVWENTNSEVYNYLNRMSQKGLIDFQDIIRPLSRQYIAKQLLLHQLTLFLKRCLMLQYFHNIYTH